MRLLKPEGIRADRDAVETDERPKPSWDSASAAEIAGAAGATDLFVLRRVASGRFAHVGGAGRGIGWAGIVEVGVGEEPLLEEAVDRGIVVRREGLEPWHVFGPYYGCTVAAVPVSSDVLVVFGADPGVTLPSDGDLEELAQYASESLIEVAPAKRLADELEALEAVQALLNQPGDTFAEGLQRLVDETTRSLSCEVGLAYVPERDVVAVCDVRNGDAPRFDREGVRAALMEIATLWARPSCVQHAAAEELPAPLGSSEGIVSYYLLSIDAPLPGILLLLHTDARAPRGFTQLCQSLGVKLVAAAEPLLSAALLRDRLREDLERTAAEARRDPLTGLANRLAWDEAIAGASACPDAPATVVELDCGGLKLINDTLGHGTGDRLLQRVAEVLLACVREGDVVARLGGDEFGLLLCGADEQVGERVVARIKDAASARREDGEPEICLAIGSATERDGDIVGAQHRADQQLLEAKRARRAAFAESAAG